MLQGFHRRETIEGGQHGPSDTVNLKVTYITPTHTKNICERKKGGTIAKTFTSGGWEDIIFPREATPGDSQEIL